MYTKNGIYREILVALTFLIMFLCQLLLAILEILNAFMKGIVTTCIFLYTCCRLALPVHGKILILHYLAVYRNPPGGTVSRGCMHC